MGEERGWRTAKCAVLALFLCRPGAGEAVELGGIQWAPSYAVGLVRARKAGRPLLVYFPPTGNGSPPAVLRRASRAMGSPASAEPVQVAAREVAAVLKRFRVRKLPALLVVDQRENVVARWEGEISGHFWSDFAGSLRKLRRRQQGAQEQLDAARRFMADGRVDGALGRVAPLVQNLSTPLGVFQRARQLETEIVRAQMAGLLEVLAGEGLLPDRRLALQLRRLRSRRLHRRVALRVEDELVRLQTTQVGAGVE